MTLDGFRATARGTREDDLRDALRDALARLVAARDEIADGDQLTAEAILVDLEVDIVRILGATS